MMSAQTSSVFHYKTHYLLNALMEGQHKSRRQGPGSEFYRKASFLSEPNPARVDLARSLVDPFETLYVKTFRQQSELDVVTLADGSHSMLNADKANMLSDAVECISRSVFDASDKAHSFLLTETITTKADQTEWQSLINDLAESDHSQTASSFEQLYYEVPQQRSLIFVVSDFHWPEQQLKSLLSKLSAHIVVPVVIWAEADNKDYPLWRFIQVQDAESGEQHLLFTTPCQKRQLAQAFTERKAKLNNIFNVFGHRPLWLTDAAAAPQFNRYFLGE